MEKASFKQYLTNRANDKAFMCIIIAYLALCLASAIYWCVEWQARNLMMSLVFMLFAPLVFIVEHFMKIRFGELFVASVLFLAIGSILGSCFNLYMIIPFFDTLLHGFSGLIFACLGFALAERFFGKASGAGSFFGCLVFAACFSLSIAVAWEIFEYACTAAFGVDMMEDTYVTGIKSYLLAGAHTETVDLEGIVKTVVYLENGDTYTINGYLDIGLIDTLTDMIICSVGTAVFALLLVFSYIKCPRLKELIIPRTDISSIPDLN